MVLSLVEDVTQLLSNETTSEDLPNFRGHGLHSAFPTATPSHGLPNHCWNRLKHVNDIYGTSPTQLIQDFFLISDDIITSPRVVLVNQANGLGQLSMGQRPKISFFAKLIDDSPPIALY